MDAIYYVLVYFYFSLTILQVFLSLIILNINLLITESMQSSNWLKLVLRIVIKTINSKLKWY